MWPLELEREFTVYFRERTCCGVRLSQEAECLKINESEQRPEPVNTLRQEDDVAAVEPRELHADVVGDESPIRDEQVKRRVV